jgi:hypothetical protein
MERVNWASFEGPEARSLDLMRKRLKLGAKKPLSEEGDTDRRRLKLQKASAVVAELLRSILLAEGFPPHGLSEAGTSGDARLILGSFRPVDSNDLATRLHIALVLSCINEVAGQLEISLALALKRGEVDSNELKFTRLWTTTYEGLEGDASSLGERLLEELILGYDRALGLLSEFEKADSYHQEQIR